MSSVSTSVPRGQHKHKHMQLFTVQYSTAPHRTVASSLANELSDFPPSSSVLQTDLGAARDPSRQQKHSTSDATRPRKGPSTSPLTSYLYRAQKQRARARCCPPSMHACLHTRRGGAMLEARGEEARLSTGTKRRSCVSSVGGNL